MSDTAVDFAPQVGQSASSAPDAAVAAKPVLTQREVVAQRSHAKQTRREAMATWVPHTSTPYQMKRLLLKTAQAQYTYHLGLVMAQRSLYFIFHTLPENSAAVRAAEKVVNQTIDKVREAVVGEKDRLQAVMSANMLDEMDGYTKPLAVNVAMYCPEAERIGEIIEAYDRMVALADTLLWGTFLDRTKCADLKHEYRVMIIGMTRKLFLLYRSAQNAVNRQRAARIAKEQRKLERREARQAGDAADANEAQQPARSTGGAAGSEVAQELAVKAEPKPKRAKRVKAEPRADVPAGSMADAVAAA